MPATYSRERFAFRFSSRFELPAALQATRFEAGRDESTEWTHPLQSKISVMRGDAKELSRCRGQPGRQTSKTDKQGMEDTLHGCNPYVSPLPPQNEATSGRNSRDTSFMSDPDKAYDHSSIPANLCRIAQRTRISLLAPATIHPSAALQM